MQEITRLCEGKLKSYNADFILAINLFTPFLCFNPFLESVFDVFSVEI